MTRELTKKPDVVSVTADKDITPETQRALVDVGRAALRMMRLEREIENEEETLP